MTDDRARSDLQAILDAALAGADAGTVVAAHLPSPRGRTLVVGAGKAAGVMAQAVEAAWDVPFDGLVVMPEGYQTETRLIRQIGASHPLPGLEAQAAAAETLVRASMLTAEDQLLVLLSGGASALWPAPRRPLTLDGKRAITTALLRSGAPIAEINAVRKHLSRIKGGRLAKAAGPCPIVALAVSDVPGDDPAIIGSGPVSPDPTTREQARDILVRRGVPMTDALLAVIDDPASETPKAGDPCFDRVDYRLILKPADMLAATAAKAGALGYEPILLGDDLQGEAEVIAADHAARAVQALEEGRRVALISGGELTVTLTGSGQGGPNRAYLLHLAIALRGTEGIAAFAADTDGIDGTPDAAGAMIFPTTLARARAMRLDAAGLAQANDSGGFFAALRDAIITGPTRTNVNDVRVILVNPTG